MVGDTRVVVDRLRTHERESDGVIFQFVRRYPSLPALGEDGFVDLQVRS